MSCQWEGLDLRRKLLLNYVPPIDLHCLRYICFGRRMWTLLLQEILFLHVHCDSCVWQAQCQTIHINQRRLVNDRRCKHRQRASLRLWLLWKVIISSSAINFAELNEQLYLVRNLMLYWTTVSEWANADNLTKGSIWIFEISETWTCHFISFLGVSGMSQTTWMF